MQTLQMEIKHHRMGIYLFTYKLFYKYKHALKIHHSLHARIQKDFPDGVQLVYVFLLLEERGSKYHYKRAIIGPPSKPFRWRADGGPTLNAGL